MSSLAQIMTSTASLRVVQPAPITNNSAPAPSTPTRTNEGMLGSSPVPSPSHIPRYLSYAERKLGVSNATSLAPEFMSKGWGPDIIANVPLDEIKEKVLSIKGSEGDAIRLQKNGAKWWKSSEAKRKRSATQSGEHWVQYNCEDANGGMRGWPGHPPKRGRTTDMDRNTTYFDDQIGQRVTIPEGWTAGEALKESEYLALGGDKEQEIP